MIFRLFVHGTPRGQAIWPLTSSESRFLQSYYRSYNYPDQMIVEIEYHAEGNPFVWYSYIVSDTLDFEGRPGGYFGLSLCMDVLDRDFSNIFHLLKATFLSFFVGNIIVPKGNKYMYKVGELAPFDRIVKEAEKQVINYICQFSSDTDLTKIPKSSNNNNQQLFINLLDYNSQDCEKILSCQTLLISNSILTRKSAAQIKSLGQDRENLLKGNL